MTPISTQTTRQQLLPLAVDSNAALTSDLSKEVTRLLLQSRITNIGPTLAEALSHEAIQAGISTRLGVRHLLAARAALHDGVRNFLLYPHPLAKEQLAKLGELFEATRSLDADLDRVDRISKLIGQSGSSLSSLSIEERAIFNGLSSAILTGLVEVVESAEGRKHILTHPNLDTNSLTELANTLSEKLFNLTYSRAMADKYYARGARHLGSYTVHEEEFMKAVSGGDVRDLRTSMKSLEPHFAVDPNKISLFQAERDAFQVLRAIIALAEDIPVLRFVGKEGPRIETFVHAAAILATFAQSRVMPGAST